MIQVQASHANQVPARPGMSRGLAPTPTLSRKKERKRGWISHSMPGRTRETYCRRSLEPFVFTRLRMHCDGCAASAHMGNKCRGGRLLPGHSGQNCAVEFLATYEATLPTARCPRVNEYLCKRWETPNYRWPPDLEDLHHLQSTDPWTACLMSSSNHTLRASIRSPLGMIEC